MKVKRYKPKPKKRLPPGKRKRPSNSLLPQRKRNPLRIDPTRTGRIRKAFITRLRKVFAAIRKEVIHLVRDEDAFGLDPKINGLAANANDFFRTCDRDDKGRCLPGGGGGSSGSGKTPRPRIAKAAISERGGRQVERSSGNAHKLIRRLDKGTIHPDEVIEEAKRLDAEERRYARSTMRASFAEIRGAWKKRFGEESLKGKEFSRVRQAYRKGLEDANYSIGQVTDAIRSSALSGEKAGKKEDKRIAKATKGISDAHTRTMESAFEEFRKMAMSRPKTNQRWRFNSDPDKVRQFIAWLRQRIRTRLTSVQEEELWRRYVEEGLRQGAGRAFTDTRAIERLDAIRDERLDFYEGTKQEFLRSAFNRPEAVSKVKLLAGRSFTDLRGISSDMSRRMSHVLTDGLVRGMHPNRIAKELAESIDITRARAETIARTEIIRAHAEGQLMAMEDLGVEEVGVMVEWSTAGDDHVCPKCEPMEGVVLKLDEAKGMIPRHPNCIPGTVEVLSGGTIHAASRRLYDGDLVVLRTASGQELPCTPNHPILTDRGFIPASLIDPGMHVVGDGRRQWKLARNYKHQDVPARIHQIADALRSSSEVLAAKVPVSAPDFHGDGMDGDVAIVWSYRKLVDADVTSQSKFRRKNLFVSGAGGQSLSGSCDLYSVIDALGLPPNRIMRCLRLLLPLIFGHRSPLQDFSFARSPDMHSGRFEPGANRLSRNSVFVGHRLLGKAVDVVGNDRFAVDEPKASGDVPVAKYPDDDFVGYAELASQLTSGRSGPVFLDQVVSKTVKLFSGHVYNLETEFGWYAANGIITHNCRCAWVPANVGESKVGQTRGKARIEGAIGSSDPKGKDRFGPGREIARDRPTPVVRNE